MIAEIVNISVSGKAIDDAIPDMIEVEVEEDTEQASAARVRIAIEQNDDGTWSYLDDPRFQLWNALSVDAGFDDGTETIFDGYITHIELAIQDPEQESWIELSGLDRSCVMDIDEQQLAWVNKADHEIAKTIFAAHGLSYEVEDTVVQHAEKVSTTMQTETDIRFLRRLAARNGFECFVQGAKGYFRSPDTKQPPQKVLSTRFGEETNLASLNVREDGTPPTQVEIRRVDPMSKQPDTKMLSASPLRQIGSKPLASLRSGKGQGHVLLKRQLSAYDQEMQGRLRTAYEPATRFVRAEGEIDSRTYGTVLRARRLVTIKGAGAGLSGIYYLRRVRHVFSMSDYKQHFDAYRNGTGLLGSENFGDTSLLPIPIPAVSLGGGSLSGSGNVVLPAQQTGSSLPGGL